MSILCASIALAAQLSGAPQRSLRAKPTPQFEALPLTRVHQNHLVVRAFINNKPASLIVDTGAPHTIIARNRRQYFGLTRVGPNSDLPERVKINGTFNSLTVAHSVRLGGLNVVDVPAVLVDLAEEQSGERAAQGLEPDGILGIDILAASRAVLDCRQQVLILNMFPEKGGRVPGLDFRGFHKVPMDLIGGRPYVDAAVNGMAVRLLVDTGAVATMLHRPFVQALQIPLQKTGIRSAAINVKEDKVQLAQIRNLSLGSLGLIEKHVGVIDLGGVIHGGLLNGSPPVAGLLGAEVLSRLHGIVDFGTRTLYLRAETKQGRPGARRSSRPGSRE